MCMWLQREHARHAESHEVKTNPFTGGDAGARHQYLNRTRASPDPQAVVLLVPLWVRWRCLSWWRSSKASPSTVS